MKDKNLIITAIIFFLIINTAYYWQGKLGFLALLVFLILFVSFIVLGILLLKEMYYALSEKFIDKNRLLKIGILLPILTLTFFAPHGLINFEKFEGDDILIAKRKGAGNCITTFKLKNNYKFIEKSVCFGINEIKGNYYFKNDTIFFKILKLNLEDKSFYKFAVIKPSNIYKDDKNFVLVRFRSSKDTIGNVLFIEKNEINQLIKKPKG